VSPGDAVVYGSGVDVFTAAQALLGLGVRGGRVHLVLTPGASSGLGDPVVEKAVAAALEEAEVRVHRGRLLALMNDGRDPEPLASVTFASDGEPLLQLQCAVRLLWSGYGLLSSSPPLKASCLPQVFLNVSNKGVDRDAFRSIADSFLVFDGRLVVSAAFHTGDPAVSGAGPLTKLSRCYHAGGWSHADFNSKEVGRDLAARLLPLFDPTLEGAAETPPPDAERLPPLYTQPKIQGQSPAWSIDFYTTR